MRRLAVAGGAIALLIGSSAMAASHGAKGSSLFLRDGTKKQIKAASKDGTAIPQPSSDPATVGASLEVILVDSQGAQTETFQLPAAGWKTVKGVSKFKAKGTGITSVLVQPNKQLKIAGSPLGLTLANAPAIRASVYLTIGGDVYCLDFTTPANPNTMSLAKWGLQTVAGVCPSVTTTTSTSTTTTTTIVSCGDGAIEGGEQCDDGNTIDCDGCDSNCTLSSTCGNGITCAPEQCDGGPNCNDQCETTGSTCGTANGQRLVIVSLNVPQGHPLAGVQVLLEYPQFQTSIPGSGNSSEVNSRVFTFPTGDTFLKAVNDSDTDLNVVFANATNFLNGGPLFAVNFDECVDISQNLCNRAQTVIGCCGNPNDPNQFPNTCGGFTNPKIVCTTESDCPVLTSANDADCTAANTPYGCCTGSGTGTCSESAFCTGASLPNACCTGPGTGTCTADDQIGRCTFRCPGNPPVCAPGHFPVSAPAGPCDNLAGACPGDNQCVDQVGLTKCTVSSPVEYVNGNAEPVSGVTCTVTIL